VSEWLGGVGMGMGMIRKGRLEYMRGGLKMGKEIDVTG